MKYKKKEVVKIGLEQQLVLIRKDLEPTILESEERTKRRADLEVQYLNVLTPQDRQNYRYQQSLIATRDNNVEKAQELESIRLKESIENKEHNIKILKKRLEDTPATDFEQRLNLLAQLDEQTGELEIEEEIKAKTDRGVTLTDKEKQIQIQENYEEKEIRKEEFEKATETAEIIVEEQKEKLGENAVANPIEANLKDDDRATRETYMEAATAAILIDDPREKDPDSFEKNGGQFAAIAFIIELEKGVRDPEVPEDAKAIVENDEAITKANEELERKQEEIEQKI